MSRRPIGKPSGKPSIPKWTAIPGFDISLDSLPVGTRLNYKLEPRPEGDKTSIKRGVWDNSTYRAEVVWAKRGKEIRKRLKSLDRGTFIVHAKELLGREQNRWIIELPANCLNDGSSVWIGRFWTGSGISRDMAPSGWLHDKLSRWWIDNDGKIPVRFTLGGKIHWVEVSVKEMALIWGASVQYLTPRPDSHVRVMEWVLAKSHPILIRYGSKERWEELILS